MCIEIKYRTLSFLGYPKYQVGTDGSFWRWTKVRGWTRRKINRCGVVGLCRGGKAKSYMVGRLVLLAFKGPCPTGKETCHNPDPSVRNNRLENLRWDTHISNMKDRRRHGNWKAVIKLNNEKVRKMRNWRKKGATVQSLANWAGVSIATASFAIRGKTWSE